MTNNQQKISQKISEWMGEKYRVVGTITGVDHHREVLEHDYSTIHSADGKRVWEKVTGDVDIYDEFRDYCSVEHPPFKPSTRYSIWFINNFMSLFADFLQYCFDNGKHEEWFYKECIDVKRGCDIYDQDPAFIGCDKQGRILTELGRLMKDGK